MVCLLWSVPFCYLNGYPEPPFDPAEISTTMGVPTWLFWGIAVPWALAAAVSTWLSFAYIQDDDLGEAPEEIAQNTEDAS